MKGPARHLNPAVLARRQNISALGSQATRCYSAPIVREVGQNLAVKSRLEPAPAWCFSVHMTMCEGQKEIKSIIRREEGESPRWVPQKQCHEQVTPMVDSHRLTEGRDGARFRQLPG